MAGSGGSSLETPLLSDPSLMTKMAPMLSMLGQEESDLSGPEILEEGRPRGTNSSGDRPSFRAPPARLTKAQELFMKYNAIFTGNSVERAAALISQAVDGKGIPPELIGNPRFSHLVQAHIWLKRLKPFWNMVEIVLLLLNFLDAPAWCAGNCNLKMMREDYMAGSVPYVSSVKVNTIQVICALCLSFKIYLQAIISRPTNIKIVKKYGVKMLAVFVLYLDSSLFFIGYMFPWIAGKAPNVDGSTIVRVLVVIVFQRDIRRSMVVLLNILPEFLNMGALVAIYVVFFAWMGRFIFHDSAEGPHAFSDIGNSLASMFTLILAINNPVVWTPAYKENPISCLFFITFLVIGVYLMMSLLFSVVFRGYRQRLADNLAKEVTIRRRCLDKAFKFLDLEDKGRITFQDLTKLLDVLHVYLELPHVQTDKIKFYFEVLDKDADHSIDQEEFHDFLTAIVMKFSKKYEPSWLEIQMECTKYYGQFLDVKSFVNGPYFEWMMIAVHVLNLSIIILETELDIRGSHYQVYVQFVQIALVFVYIFELVFHIMIVGFEMFWRDPSNRVHFMVDIASVVIVVFWFLDASNVESLSWLRLILLLQLVRLVELFRYFERTKQLIDTMKFLLPAIMPLLEMVFCLLSLYTAIGVQVFGGKLRRNHPALVGTMFARLDYWSYNYNDYVAGMVLSFNLMIGRDWIVFAKGYVAATGTLWTSVFFIVNYITIVLLTVKVVVSFVLHGFLSQMSQKHVEAIQQNAQKAIESRSVSDNLDVLATMTKSVPRMDVLCSILGVELEQAKQRLEDKEIRRSQQRPK